MRIKLAALALLAGTALPLAALADSTVKFWYHFDNPENPMADLVAKFEAANPGIKIDAQNVPWNSYYDNLYTAIVGGNAPARDSACRASSPTACSIENGPTAVRRRADKCPRQPRRRPIS